MQIGKHSLRDEPKQEKTPVSVRGDLGLRRRTVKQVFAKKSKRPMSVRHVAATSHGNHEQTPVTMSNYRYWKIRQRVVSFPPVDEEVRSRAIP